jgi:hypothetical protein
MNIENQPNGKNKIIVDVLEWILYPSKFLNIYYLIKCIL